MVVSCSPLLVTHYLCSVNKVLSSHVRSLEMLANSFDFTGLDMLPGGHPAEKAPVPTSS